MNGDERIRRWRLVLGGEEAEGTGAVLSVEELAMDRCLTALYGDREAEDAPTAGLGSSRPSVSRWLGDIRKYFPTPVVKVMQQDAYSRLGLQRMLLEPELLSDIEPDVTSWRPSSG